MDSRSLVVIRPGMPGLSELMSRAGAEMGPIDVGIGIWDAVASRLIGAAVFNNYDFANIEISVYLDESARLTKGMIEAMFTYPFLELQCARVTARTRAGNAKTRQLIRRLGFKPEGRLRWYFGDDDAMIYGMPKAECKWIPANG